MDKIKLLLVISIIGMVGMVHLPELLAPPPLLARRPQPLGVIREDTLSLKSATPLEVTIPAEVTIPMKIATAAELADFGEIGEVSSSIISELTLTGALEMSLQNNYQLKLERLSVPIKEADLERQRARFDSNLTISAVAASRQGRSLTAAGTPLADNFQHRGDFSAEISRLNPSGTVTSLEVSQNRTRSAVDLPLYTTRAAIEVRTPLQQGAGREVNLVSINQALLNLEISRHQLSEYIISLIASIERNYWNLYTARRELEIVNESCELAQMQLEETKNKIELGSVAESELAAAQAELAVRREAIINAESNLKMAEIALLRQLNPAGTGEFWNFQLQLADSPSYPNGSANEISAYGELEEHLATALQNRPELNQARLLLKRGQLEIIRTENGLLPRLDMVLTLGKSGIDRSLSDGFSDVFASPGGGAGGGLRPYDVSAGLVYQIPLDGNRDAEASHRRAVYTTAQLENSLYNLRQLISEDVIRAHLEVQRSLQQLEATALTVQHQLEKLRVENTRFALGKSTAFQVAQAQRDVTGSQVSQLKARVGYQNALISLYRADGSLAQRRGFVAVEARQ